MARVDNRTDTALSDFGQDMLPLNKDVCLSDSRFGHGQDGRASPVLSMTEPEATITSRMKDRKEQQMSQHELKKTEGHQNNSAFAYYRGYGSMSRLSVEQQRDSAASYAKEHDLQIVEEYMDINGLGKAADCPEFQRMMAEISVSRPSTLFVYKRSSMSRNIEEYIHALKTVEAAGCSIVFTAEMEPDTDSLTGKLWDLLLAYEER